MGLFDLFKPEWQKSDVEVRKDAVIKLNANNQSAIETVALSDTDSEIRGIAIRKLESKEVLQKVIDSETQRARYLNDKDWQQGSENIHVPCAVTKIS